MIKKNQFTTEAERKSEAEKAQRGPLKWVLPSTVLVAAWDSWYFYLFLEKDVSFYDWMFFKSLIVGTLLVVSLILHMRNQDIRLISFLTLFSLALGPFGSALFLLMLVFYLVYSMRANIFSEWLENLFPSKNSDPVLLLYERILQRWDDLSTKEDTIPYRDIMALGNTEQKQAAIAKIGKDFRPDLAPVLLEALNDKTNAIRVQVATTLAKLDRNFTNQIITLEEQHSKIPNDIDVIKKVAYLCYNRAVSGLVEAEKIDGLLEKALDYFIRFLHFKADAEVELRLAKTHMALDQLDDAKVVLDKLLDEKNSRVLSKVYVAYMELLYNLKDFSAISEFCLKHSIPEADENIETYQLLANIRLWAMSDRKVIS